MIAPASPPTSAPSASTAGDTVMVHASVRAVGEIAGGPDEIHLAIKDVVKPAGTLMMYASCPHIRRRGRARQSLARASEAELREKLPAFDPETARSARDNGALVELLRTWPGSRVNPHVVRFVAWGRHAEDLFVLQPWDYAFGRGSALERFLDLDGKLLLLGCDHDTVTFLHYAEHVADLPGKRVSRYQVPVLENGAHVWRWMEEVDTSETGAHPNWPDRFFARIVDAFLKATSNAGGRVGDARTHLIRARDLFDFACPIMELVARDARGADEVLARVDR